LRGRRIAALREATCSGSERSEIEAAARRAGASATAEDRSVRLEIIFANALSLLWARE